jgi:hypothetical protein
MMLDLEPVQVSATFGNSLSIIREKAAARDIGLGMDAAEELGSIQADRLHRQATRLQGFLGGHHGPPRRLPRPIASRMKHVFAPGLGRCLRTR